MNHVRELVRGKPHWQTLAKADRIVANATFADRAGLACHMVESHGWVPYTGTLRDRST